MDLEGVMLSDRSQTKTNTVEYKKQSKPLTITKRKEIHRYRELVVIVGREEGEGMIRIQD